MWPQTTFRLPRERFFTLSASQEGQEMGDHRFGIPFRGLGLGTLYVAVLDG
jgi:hypothetical protein